MSLHADFLRHTLRFRFAAGTSRGILTERPTYVVRLSDPEQPGVVGYGECAPLPGLSRDDRPDFARELTDICRYFSELNLELFPFNVPIILSQLISQQLPSVLFGFETAMMDYMNGGRRVIQANEFVQGQRDLPINGLIWMDTREAMQDRIDTKLSEGYTTLKLKIGAINFTDELALLRYIRSRFPADQISLRVDANGAFTPEEAPRKLAQLAELDLHSIEQPIRPGQPELMAALCRQTPLPIALDEELIGCMEYIEKFRLLKRIQPQFIVLKPTLLGGMRHCDEWIELANRLGIGWWITSALESNIGLNAIAQYTAQYKHLLPQGLGTGELYHNNFASPLTVEGGLLRYDLAKPWDLSPLI
jgi:o-succinylbenzoate synthase